MVKVGPFTDLHAARLVAETLASVPRNGVPLVLDLCGHDSNASDTYAITKDNLLLLAAVVVTNVAQAESMLGRNIKSIDDMKLAASKLASSATSSVLLQYQTKLRFTTLDALRSVTTSLDTRVHWSEGCGPILAAILRQSCAIDPFMLVEVDVLYSPGSPAAFLILVRPFIPLLAELELGCTTSAAIACRIANGKSGEHSNV